MFCWTIFGHVWAILWKIRLNNRFKSSGNATNIFWKHKRFFETKKPKTKKNKAEKLKTVLFSSKGIPSTPQHTNLVVD